MADHAERKSYILVCHSRSCGTQRVLALVLVVRLLRKKNIESHVKCNPLGCTGGGKPLSYVTLFVLVGNFAATAHFLNDWIHHKAPTHSQHKDAQLQGSVTDEKHP